MTVQTRFHSYQQDPLVPDPKTCSPLLRTLSAYLVGRWGGRDLGCYVARPIIGGSTPSSHSSGAALDWRWEDPGPGRLTLESEVLPFLLDNSLELGIQAVHDYVGDRIWRPPGTSGRPSGPTSVGWRDQNGAGDQMGESWARWIHIEVHPSRWHETRPIDDLIKPPSTETITVEFEFAKITEGTRHPDVITLKILLRHKFGQTGLGLGSAEWRDHAGPPFTRAVRAAQTWMNETAGFGLTVDGIPGPKTIRALLEYELNSA